MKSERSKGRAFRARRAAAAATVALLGAISAGAAAAGQEAVATEGYLEVGPDMRLRRMVVSPTQAKGTVLFLHGFPETMLAWKEAAATLGRDFEVHAFDWPGYGDSSRPPADQFSYAPRAYADVLQRYIDKAGIDRQRLVIYATDIGALPALLAAIDRPDIAHTIIVGDFAPFNRPQYMQERLQAMKDPKSAPVVRKVFNDTRDEILQNAFTRGLPDVARYELSAEYRADMARGWQNGSLTSADAFYHYYSHFTRDQDAFEAALDRLKTPVKVVWGERDIFITPGMGAEFAARANAPLHVLPGVGHYPHLQDPQHAVEAVREAFR
ncbi:alpha/beta fold hydrolase [Cupriavidus pauculus]|uniref:alpha/beta fold hydrolase n=1 Tax=Cupriavidus pauculus TaxID=82633 RepID=UPI001EE1E59A|nr:alpha/beta hydrolase [Cupriavidus pauculus]GJG98427.1 alpha/beta hydrolase [Cupriavidus pauculus]